MWEWLRSNLGFPSNSQTKYIPAEPLKAYPSVEDAEQARAGGYGYGDPQSAYIEGKAGNVFGRFRRGKKVDPFVPKMQEGSLSKLWDQPQANLTGQSGVSSGLLKDRQDAYTRAHLAANYSPVAALGLEGRNSTMDASGEDFNIGGAFNEKRDRMWFSEKDPGSLLHESTHRGLRQLGKDPRMSSSLRNRISGDGEEYVVRQLMAQNAGDPEQQPMDIQQKRIALQNPLGSLYLKELNDLVAETMKERRPRGPR